MSFKTVCDAWMADLVAVSGLTTAVRHLYAPWSVESLFTMAGERHIAVWPEAEAEQMGPLLTDGSQLAEQEFVVTIWEDAGGDVARVQDDETLDGAWLDLYELVRARFFVSANLRLGNSAIMRTRPVGGSFPTVGGLRVMQLRFRVQIPYTMA